MAEPLRVFLGFDSTETLSYHVAAHSIIRRATGPVSITPVALRHLQSVYTRPRGVTESTEFSISRFLVPYLCGFRGMAVFCDSDILVLDDIYKLAECATQPGKAIYVCKHDYTPKAAVKMDGQQQTKYPRKNWSSVCVFTNEECQTLQPQYVNSASGLDLHRFKWISDEQIGALPLEWNFLVGEGGQTTASPKVLHFTQGGPWLPAYSNCEYADLWFAERDHMLGVPAALASEQLKSQRSR